MSWLGRSEKKHRYLVIMLKSGEHINVCCDNRVVAEDTLGKVVKAYAENPAAAVLFGDLPAPLFFLVNSELAAIYVSMEARRRNYVERL